MTCRTLARYLLYQRELTRLKAFSPLSRLMKCITFLKRGSRYSRISTQTPRSSLVKAKVCQHIMMSKRRRMRKPPETRGSHLLKHQIQSAVANPGWVYLKPSQPKSSSQNDLRQLMKQLIYIKVSQLANSQPKQATRDHVREASHLPKPRGNHKYQRIKEANQPNVHKHFKHQTEERPTRNKLQI